MADADPKTSPQVRDERADPGKRFPPPQLRLHDRQVFVGFGATPLAEGLTLSDLALVVPEVSFPFDISGSAATRYQKKKCRFGYLDVRVDTVLVDSAVKRIREACSEQVKTLELAFRSESVEGQGTLHGDVPTSFTFRVGIEPDGADLGLYFHDVRLYGPSPLPAPCLAALLAKATVRAAVLPGAELRGAACVVFSPVPALLRKAVPLRGFRLPEMADARLARVAVSEEGVTLHIAAGASPPGARLDEDLLLTTEGTRSFARGETQIASGDLRGAEAWYLRNGEAPEAHPFAQERLLTLLAARPEAHDLALDVADVLRRKRPGAAATHWAEALIRLHRGEGRAAGEAFLRLAQLARQRGEEAGAFFAFVAAGEAFEKDAPLSASRAYQEALSTRPDDLPALLKLAAAADVAHDHEGALKAYRRIAVLARDPAQAARAHVRQGELLVRIAKDHPGARLHFETALRLVPDDADALFGLADLCAKSGEHLRAIRCLDRLREVAPKNDTALQAEACLRAGRAWEDGLGNDANALLRYQEAAQLSPENAEVHFRTARLLERAGRVAEALEAYLRAVSLARAPRNVAERDMLHAARHALAVLALDRLQDPSAAREHYEAALALKSDDLVALRALMPSWRETGRHAELARACETCAAVVVDPVERARLYAEAGELYRTRLDDADRAHLLFDQALLSDPGSREALSGVAELLATRGDGRALCRILLRLAERASDSAEKLVYLRRLLNAARELANDLDLAADTARRALTLAPDDLSLHQDLCVVERRRDDPAALATALEGLAATFEQHGRFAEAASALRELARLTDAKLGRAAKALEVLEKALTLSPEDPGLLADLGHVALRADRARVAREAFKAVLDGPQASLEPSQHAELQAAFARACDALGQRDEAITAFAAALALRHDESLATRLDQLYAEAGRTKDRATLALSRARAELSSGQRAHAASLFSSAAILFQRVSDAPSAQACFSSSLEADPEGPSAAAALDALAQLASAAGDTTRAATLLARRAGLDKDNRGAARRLFQAAGLVRDSDADRYRSLLLASVARDGLFPPARHALALLCAAESDHGQVLAHVQAALTADRADGLAAEPRAALHRIAASAARALGEREAARRHLTAYCDAQPSDLKALAELAQLHRDAHDRTALAKVLQTLSSSGGPEVVPSLVELADVLREEGRRAEALDALRRAAALVPGDLEALRALAAALDQPADASERASLLLKLADVSSGETAHRHLLDAGEALLDCGEPARALEAFRRAARTNPRSAKALDQLAQAAALAKDADEELDALLRRAQLAAGSGETDASARYASLGLKLLASQRPDEAAHALTRALELSPSPEVSRDALSGLVELAESQSDRRAAAQRLEQLSLLLKGSERAAVLVRRAEHLKVLKDRVGAREALAHALDADPRDRRAVLALKALCAEEGDREGYAAMLESLLALGVPDRREAARLSFELAEILSRELDEAERGEGFYRRALELDRHHAGASEGLFDVLLQRGALAEALPLGERLAMREQDPRAAAARLARLARLASESLHDRGLALRYGRRVLEADPSDTSTALTLAEALYDAGGRAEALALHRRLLGAVRFDEAPDRWTALHLRYAELSFDAGQPQACVDALRALLERAPTCTAAAELLYDALSPTDPRAALAALEAHARSLAPGRRAFGLLMRLADDARLQLQDRLTAARLYAAARDLAPEPLEIDLTRAALLRESGDARQLAQVLEAIAEQSLAQGDTERARAVLDELSGLKLSLGEAAGAAESLGRLARLYADAGRIDEAAARLRRRGELLRDAVGDDRAAEEAFRHALELLPADLESAKAAAELCRRRGDAEGEAALLDRIIGLLPSDRTRTAPLLRLANLFLSSLDSPARAESALTAALALDAELSEARDLLERVFAAQARHGELARSIERRATGADRDAAVALYRSAAAIYLELARDLTGGARALASALALAPEDLLLAEATAEALHAAGRDADADAIDAQILEKDVARSGPFERRLARLQKSGDEAALASLLEARAGREAPASAAAMLLDASRLRSSLGDASSATRNEEQAFAIDPANHRAFDARLARVRAGSDVGAVSEVLARRAAAVPAEAAGLHRTRAELLARAGRREDASRALDAVLLLAPEDADALAARAALASALAGDAAAQPFDSRLVALAEKGRELPDTVLADARFRLGFAAASASRALDAAAHFEAAAALAPEHARIDESLNRLDALLSGAERATLVRICLALEEQVPAERRLALLERAAAAASDATSAIPALERLAALRKNDLSTQDRLARALFAARRYGDLADVQERAASLCESDEERAARLLETATLATNELGDEARAARLRSQAFLAAPANLDVVRAVLPDLRASGAIAGLIEALTALIERSADAAETASARLELARTLDATGDARAAESFAAIARQGRSAPGFAEAARRAFELDLSAGNFLRASEILALQADALGQGGGASDLHLQAAALLEQQANNPDGARAALDRAIAADPDAAKPRAALAAFLERRGDRLARAGALREEAARTADAARKSELLLERGQLLQDLGRSDEAREAFAAAVDARPDDLAARLALADALAETSPEKTLAQLQVARRLSVSPEQKDALTRRSARLAASLGDTASATAAWSELLAGDASDLEAFQNLAAHAEQSNDGARLLELVERRLTAKLDAPERLALVARRAALLSSVPGRDADAEAAWKAVLALDDHHRPALTALRRAAEKKGEASPLADALRAELALVQDAEEGFALAMKLGALCDAELKDPAAAADGYGQATRWALKLTDGRTEKLAAAQRAVARALAASGDHAAALLLLDERLQDPADSGDVELRELAADCSLATGDTSAARRHLMLALEHAPLRDASFARLEKLAEREGEAILAPALSLRVLALADAAHRLPLHLRLGRIHRAAGDRERAVRAFNEALTCDAACSEAWDALEGLHGDVGEFDKLCETYERRALTVAGAERARRFAAAADLRRTFLHDDDAAVRDLEQALAADASSPGVAELLAELLFERGDLDRAAPLFERLASGGSALPAGLASLRLAVIREKQGRTAEALEQFRAAAPVVADRTAALRGLLACADALKRPADALTALEALLTRPGLEEEARELHLKAADRCEELGRRGDALRHLESAEELSASLALEQRIADLCLEEHRPAEAVRWLESVAANSAAGAERASVLRRIADLSKETGDLERAVGAWERAFAEEPANAEPLEHIVRARLSSGGAPLVTALETLERARGAAAVKPFLVPWGQALKTAGRATDALRRFELALAESFTEDVAAEVCALAEVLGEHALYAAVEERRIAALTAEQSDERRDRLNALAARLEASVPEKAAELLESGFALRPPEPAELLRQAELFERRAKTLPRAARPLAQLARTTPFEPELRQRLAVAVQAAGDVERGELISSIDAFLDLEHTVTPRPLAPGAKLSDDVRFKLCGAVNPLATLAKVVAPALSSLLSAEAEPHAGRKVKGLPELSARAGRALELTGLASAELRLSDERPFEVRIVPGAPARLVVGVGALAELEPGALQFLLVRACELGRAGYAPLAFAGPERARALLDAVRALSGESLALPASVAAQRDALANALASVDAAALREAVTACRGAELPNGAALLHAMEQAAARVALLAVGHTGAALRALLRANASTSEAELAALELPELLRSPALTDVVVTALGDEAGALRRALEGR